MPGFSQILDAIQNGDAGTTEKLFPLVYDEFRPGKARNSR